MTERSESERAEFVALADRLAVFTKLSPHDFFEQSLSGSQLELIVTALRLAAQDQKPVAWQWRHPNGEWVDCDEPPPNELRDEPEKFRCLYLSPPPAAGWNENQLQSIIERALLEDDDFCTRAAYQNIRQIIARASAKAIVEAILHNAPPDSGAKLIDPIDSRGLKGARKQAAENCASMLPDHGGADAGVGVKPLLVWDEEAAAQAIYEHWANYPACNISKPWEFICEERAPQADDFRRKARAVKAALSKPAPVAANASAVATYKLGRWLSAALEDPNVCAEMKADINAWIDAGQPNIQPSDNASAEARLREQQSLVERIIIRRLHQEKLDGYTIETAREIIEALSAHPHASDCDKQGER